MTNKQANIPSRNAASHTIQNGCMSRVSRRAITIAQTAVANNATSTAQSPVL